MRELIIIYRMAFAEKAQRQITDANEFPLYGERVFFIVYLLNGSKIGSMYFAVNAPGVPRRLINLTCMMRIDRIPF